MSLFLCKNKYITYLLDNRITDLTPLLPTFYIYRNKYVPQIEKRLKEQQQKTNVEEITTLTIQFARLSSDNVQLQCPQFQND